MTGTLVTGGAGFIGSHLVDRLLADGHDVTVLDDFSTGRAENLDRRSESARPDVVDGSILDADLVDRLVSAHDLVFHLAAAVGVRYVIENPLATLVTNLRGTENVLGAAHQHGRRVVLASSSEIYGHSTAVPFREDGDRVLGPTWVHRWSYSTAKAADEHFAFAYADKGLRISIVRYFNAYGPRLDERGYGSVVASFVRQALRGDPMTVHGDGTQTRCFTYVSDTVEGTVRASQKDEALGRAFNVGSRYEVSIRELAERIRTLVGSSSRIELVTYDSAYPRGFQDMRRRVPDTTAARELLGFEAAVDLDEGLSRTVEWCRAHFEGAVRQA